MSRLDRPLTWRKLNGLAVGVSRPARLLAPARR